MQPEMTEYPPQQHTLTPQSQDLNKNLREIISSICLQDQQAIHSSVHNLKQVEVAKVSYNQVIGLQLLQKTQFIKNELESIAPLRCIVQDVAEQLIRIFQCGFRNTTKFQQIYEQQ